MDDLEDELFMLGSGKRTATKKRGRQGSYDDDVSDAEQSQDSEDNSNKKKTGKGRASQKSKVDSSDDDEDFDSEDGLFENEADKKRLLAMNELDREMILANRSEKRDKERQRKELLNQTVEEKPSSGRTGGARRGRDTRGKEMALKQITAARERRGAKAKAAQAAHDSSDDEAGGQDADDDAAGAAAADLTSEDDDDDDEFQPSSDSEADERPAARLGDDDEDEEEEVETSKMDHRRSLDDGDTREKRSDARDSAVLRSEAYADGDGDSGADEEDDRSAPQGNHPRDSYRDSAYGDDEDGEEASYEELCEIQLTRQRLEEWIEMPFFQDDQISGPVVRMAFGQRVSSQGVAAQYLVMEIVEVVDRTQDPSQHYAFGPRGTPTGKHLRLRDGMGVERVMRMANVSSKPIAMDEYERYIRHCGKMNRRPITRAEAAVAKEKIVQALNYRWRPEDLREVLRRKQEAGAMVTNPVDERVEIQRRLAALEDLASRHAERDGRDAAGARIDEDDEDSPQKVLEEIEKLHRQLASLDQHIIESGARGDSLMDLNRRNRQLNIQVAFQQKVQDLDGKGDNTAHDVFSRRATKPMIYWDTKGKRTTTTASVGGDGSDAGKAGGAEGGGAEKAGGADHGSRAGSSSSSSSSAAEDIEHSARLSAKQLQMAPLDLLRDLDLKVDLSLMEAAPAALSICRRVLGPHWTQPLKRLPYVSAEGKTVLSLEEYFRFRPDDRLGAE